MQLAEKLIQIVNDLKHHYIGLYGDVVTWDMITQDMYLLNCDGEILHHIIKNEIEVHPDSLDIGLSIGVLFLRKKTIEYFYDAYGETLDIDQQSAKFDMMKKQVFDFLINGAYDFE